MIYDPWYGGLVVDDDLPWTGKTAIMAGAAAFVWGAGMVALAAATLDHFVRRNRR